MTSELELDLLAKHRIHVVGIGGAGMSAIAEVLSSMGHDVTGSDLKASAGLERLKAQGIEVHVGHDPTNIQNVELVTRSVAIANSNVEWQAAEKAGVLMMSRAELLARISALRRTVAVAGTHGKTTTASMLSVVLREAGLSPSFIIGGDVNEIGTGAVWGEGSIFVVEADESDGSFLDLERQVGIVTNVEPDHLEFHGGFDALRIAFERFVRETEEIVLVGVDDPEARKLATGVDVSTVGTSPDAQWRMESVVEAWEGVSFNLLGPGGEYLPIELPLPGMHNARNAALAAAASWILGARSEAIVGALARFGGVARRFEHRGSSSGVVFVDDYAHLPSEVAATLRAALTRDWGRVIAVFQPHRYSRIEALAGEFGEVFDGADVIYITEVFPAGEAPRPGVNGGLIVEAIREARPESEVRYISRREDLVAGLCEELREGDLCLTMGAGDLTAVPDEVRRRMDMLGVA